MFNRIKNVTRRNRRQIKIRRATKTLPILRKGQIKIKSPVMLLAAKERPGREALQASAEVERSRKNCPVSERRRGFFFAPVNPD